MKKTSISYKSSNLLIENLKKQENIEVLKKENFISSLFGKKKYADVYFHSGNLDEKSIENIKNSKITIVNSFSSMNYIIAKTKISHEKIKVIYPSINVEYKKPKEVKIKLCEELNIDPKTKLILFTAKNFKTSGVKEFLDICSSITYSDFKIIIAGEKKQIANLNFDLVFIFAKVLNVDSYENYNHEVEFLDLDDNIEFTIGFTTERFEEYQIEKDKKFIFIFNLNNDKEKLIPKTSEQLELFKKMNKINAYFWMEDIL